MKKAIKVGWGILEVIIIVYVILMTIFILTKNKYGYTQIGSTTYVNVDKDMVKRISGVSKGSILVLSTKNVEKGKDVYFYTVDEEGYVIDRGELSSIESDTYIMKKGEHIPKGRIIGLKTMSIAGLGSYFSLVEGKIGFIFLVLLPITLVFGYQIFEFLIILKREKEYVNTIDDSNKEKEKFIDDEII